MSLEDEALGSDIREYIGWCIANRTSPRVSELASHLGKSRSALTLRFSRRSLVKLGSTLRAAQVEFAKKLLRDPHLPMWKVAECAGFSNERSFYRAFSRITGETPGAYRRTAR